MGRHIDLLAYKKAFSLAMDIFHQTRKFPSEEKYGLTSQIVRSSRSVCSNIAEGYRKRVYERHFISKLTDAQMENTETEVWIDFALSCGYIKEDVFNLWRKQNDEIGKLLDYMVNHPKKFQ